jgi:hypothetical protein
MLRISRSLISCNLDEEKSKLRQDFLENMLAELHLFCMNPADNFTTHIKELMGLHQTLWKAPKVIETRLTMSFQSRHLLLSPRSAVRVLRNGIQDIRSVHRLEP